MKTKRYLPLLLVLLSCSVVVAQEASDPKLNLMPVPASVKFHQEERLAVDGSFRVATRGHSDARLLAGISRFMRRLEGRTVLTLARDLAIDDQTTQLII